MSIGWRWIFLVVAVSLIVIGLLAWVRLPRWPIEPVFADHPIANTLGEIVAFRNRNDAELHWRQHQGLDILATPATEPSAPLVRAIAGGDCEWDPNETATDNRVYITTSSGHKYEYQHLDFEATDPYMRSYKDVLDDGTEKCSIHTGDPIGKISKAFPEGYNHLHFVVTHTEYDSDGDPVSTAIENPLTFIGPKPDLNAPVISNVYLADHDQSRWSPFAPLGSGSCTIVDGEVDVVVEVTDRDDAGSALPAAMHVGVYDLSWRACASGSPNCGWNGTHAYETLPLAWTYDDAPSISERFSLVASRWESVSEDWTGPGNPSGSVVPLTFMIVGNGGGAASWDTTESLNGTLTYPNGNYVLSVKATDFKGNFDVRSIDVCVRNAVDVAGAEAEWRGTEPVQPPRDP